MCNLGEALAERYYLKGIEKEKQEMIYELYKENMTIEFICRVVKCSEEYVEKVIEEKRNNS